MDHLHLSTVVSAAKQFLSQETVLHGLVNNAGIMATPFEMTADGHEAQWQTNYLAHWLLTSILLPRLLETSKTLPPGSVRIINLSSSGHYSAPVAGINFADPSLPRSSSMTCYGKSKLANILHTKTLHALHDPDSPSAGPRSREVWSAAVHPGLVKSELGARAELPKLMTWLLAPYKYLGGQIDADRGSWTSVFCVASPDMQSQDSGALFSTHCGSERLAKCDGRDAELAARLEDWTKREMAEGGWIGSW